MKKKFQVMHLYYASRSEGWVGEMSKAKTEITVEELRTSFFGLIKNYQNRARFYIEGKHVPNDKDYCFLYFDTQEEVTAHLIKIGLTESHHAYLH